MNIYVVSSGWASDGSGGGVVVGAGADLESAQTIADRLPGDMPVGWSDWESDPGPGPQALRWARGGIGQCRQEIVCVPLAGSSWEPVDVQFVQPDLSGYPDREIGAGVLYVGGPVTTPRD